VTEIREPGTHNDHGLSLCVINFNGRAILAQTLAAACGLRHRFDDMLVVDNGSTDGSADGIERNFPPFRVVRLGTNLGAGGARNAGLRELHNARILFIDNDVSLTDRCVTRLQEALTAHPAASLAAATIVYAHKRDTIQYDGAECHFLGTQVLLDEDRPIDAVPPAVREVGSLSTCAFLADRSRLPAGMCFDETYFYMFEDHDFGIRVRLQGSGVLSVTDAYCYHGAGTAGLSIRQLGTYSTRRVYYLIRNRWLVILKNFSLWTLLVLTPLYLVYELVQAAIVIKKRWHREWMQAFGWIVSNLPMIVQERRKVQAVRRIRDRELLVGGRLPFRAELTAGRVERAALALLDGVARAYWFVASRLI
jgi:GT2 family glycosyltransferase